MKRLSILALLFSIVVVWSLGARGSRSVASQSRPIDSASRIGDQTAAGRGLPDYDIRAGVERSQPLFNNQRDRSDRFGDIEGHRRIQGATEKSQLRRDHPQLELRWSSLSGGPSRVNNRGGALTRPTRAARSQRTQLQQLEDASRAARNFLSDNSDVFGMDNSEIAKLRVGRRFVTEHNGLSHIFLQQSISGIDLFQAGMAVHLDRQDAVISTSGELFRDFVRQDVSNLPALSAVDGLRRAVAAAESTISGPVMESRQASGVNRAQQFASDAGFARNIDAQLVFFPLTATQPRLAWQFFIWLRDTPDAYLVLIDAADGTLLYRYNLTCYDENPLRPHGLVFTTDSPTPHNPYTGIDNPPVVLQQDLPFRAEPFNGAVLFAISDPHYDWWSGASATGLISNNTDTHLDRDGTQNQPDAPRLETLDGNFSYVVNLSDSPFLSATANAAQVNLFYWVNRYHDILYRFGFNESAGNFQTSTFGLGGTGGDAIQADAQDGGGFNNANFSTPPDGFPGRVQMYLWNAFNPSRDGDFDQGVIIHELTHGLSNRLVGNASGLVGMQARGMGEGWSDYLGLVLLRTATENPDGAYGVGQYVVNRYSRGIRRYPYSTSLTANPLTLARIADNTEVHAVGEIWCSLLWEMRRLLVERFGFVEGQRQSIQLVVDGLKLTPSSPTFLDARDAILLADRVNNGGLNQCLVWKAFAKRGAGFYASTTDPTDAAPIESYAEAPFCSDTGTLTLDRKNYLPGESVSINLGDRNAPVSPLVEVRSTVTGDTLPIALTDQTGVPGSYFARLPTAPGKALLADAVLQVSADAGDQIQIRYLDSSTANGSAGESITVAGVARETNVHSDDLEKGSQGWVPAGTWAVTTSMSGSPTHSWIVRSAGNDQYLQTISLTSPTLDLSLFTDVTLSFAQSFDLLNGFNYGVIEYSADDGATWSRTRSFTGSRTSFQQASVRLRGLDGKQFGRIRFVLQNGSTVSANFWSVDDITLAARSTSATAISPGVSESPVIEAIVPAYGPPSGATRVRITGSNFTNSEDTLVTFDGLAATAIDVLGETTLTASVPAHATGPVMVRISTRRGSSARAAAFTYFIAGSPAPAPAIDLIYPVSGSTRGGTVVTVFGSGLTPETIVRFGSANGQTRYIDAHTLRSTTPSITGTGPVNVQAVNGAMQATLNQAFTYTAPTPPTVQLISPGGAATLFAGSTVSIAWNSSDNRSIKKHRLFLGHIVGQVEIQTEIAAELPGTSQSYNWQMPLSQSTTTTARIHVIATDDEGAETEVVSSTQHTIAQRWERTRVLPTALVRAESASDGNALYIFGGRTGTTDASTTGNVYRYDPATNLWTSAGLSGMPFALNGGEAGYLDGRIYIPGGSSTAGVTSAHNAYDVTMNTWVQRASSPASVTLYSLAVNTDAGVLYLTGGSTSGGTAVASARSYDPKADAWSNLPSMSSARYGHRSALIEGRLYVAGGLGSSGGLASCEVFDPLTGMWSPVTSLNGPRMGAAGFVTRDAAGNPIWLLVGGTNPARGILLGAEVLDVRTNRWQLLDNSFSLSTPRTFLGSGKVGDYFYAVAGANPTQGATASERIRGDSISPVGADSPPVLVVPDFVPAVPGEEIRVRIQASDVGAHLPLTISADSLPSGAAFTYSQATNNRVDGVLAWTPAETDRGKSFSVKFTATDGQLGDTRVTRLGVVEPTSMSAVNAADFQVGPLAADCIVAAFGTDLAVRTEIAQAVPVPFELAGTSLYVNGLPARLLFVSPQQVNFVLPSGLAPGAATLILKSATEKYAAVKVTIAPSRPAIFTVNQGGTGDAAAIATPDGSFYQQAPFDVSINGQPNILVLFGTGFRHATAAAPNDDNGVAEAVTVMIDAKPAQVHYAGAQRQFVGLDQMNVAIPASLSGGQQRRVEVTVAVNGIAANRVTVEIR